MSLRPSFGHRWQFTKTMAIGRVCRVRPASAVGNKVLHRSALGCELDFNFALLPVRLRKHGLQATQKLRPFFASGGRSFIDRFSRVVLVREVEGRDRTRFAKGLEVLHFLGLSSIRYFLQIEIEVVVLSRQRGARVSFGQSKRKSDSKLIERALQGAHASRLFRMPIHRQAQRRVVGFAGWFFPARLKVQA